MTSKRPRISPGVSLNDNCWTECLTWLDLADQCRFKRTSKHWLALLNRAAAKRQRLTIDMDCVKITTPLLQRYLAESHLTLLHCRLSTQQSVMRLCCIRHGTWHALLRNSQLQTLVLPPFTIWHTRLEVIQGFEQLGRSCVHLRHLSLSLAHVAFLEPAARSLRLWPALEWLSLRGPKDLFSLDDLVASVQQAPNLRGLACTVDCTSRGPRRRCAWSDLTRACPLMQSFELDLDCSSGGHQPYPHDDVRRALTTGWPHLQRLRIAARGEYEVDWTPRDQCGLSIALMTGFTGPVDHLADWLVDAAPHLLWFELDCGSDHSLTFLDAAVDRARCFPQLTSVIFRDHSGPRTLTASEHATSVQRLCAAASGSLKRLYAPTAVLRQQSTLDKQLDHLRLVDNVTYGPLNGWFLFHNEWLRTTLHCNAGGTFWYTASPIVTAGSDEHESRCRETVYLWFGHPDRRANVIVWDFQDEPNGLRRGIVYFQRVCSKPMRWLATVCGNSSTAHLSHILRWLEFAKEFVQVGETHRVNSDLINRGPLTSVFPCWKAWYEQEARSDPWKSPSHARTVSDFLETL